MAGLSFAGVPFLLGDHGVRRYRNLRAWAERGLVRIEHAQTAQYETLSAVDAAKRTKALSEIVRKARQNDKHRKYFDELEAWQQFVDDMIFVCERAQEQGMPSDASARRDLVRRAPLTLSVPADIKPF